ncbi:MAG: MFS transporter [Syntrophomonadaceae bacterium]|nr:MFS transporter [Syntrophomonadaceae bacterium]
MNSSVEGAKPKASGGIRWMVMVGIFVAFCIAYFDRTNINLLVADKGFTDAIGITGDLGKQGMLISAFLFCYGIFNFFVGPVVDRFGQRKIWIGAVIVWALVTFVAGFAASFGFLLMTRILLGVGESVNTPATNKTVKNFFPVNERGKANSIWLSATVGAPIIAVPFIAWLIHAFGWRGSFFALAAIGLIPLILFAYYLYNTPREHPRMTQEEVDYIEAHTDEVADEGKGSIDWGFLKSRNFWLATIGNAMVTVCLFGITSWMPKYLVETLGFSWAEMGILATLPNIAAVAGAWIAGLLADKMKNKAPLTIYSCILAGVAIWLGVGFKNPWAAAFMISVATGVAYIAVPIWYVLLQRSVNPNAMATGAGFYNGVCYVLSSAAPVALGFAAGYIGFAGGFLLMIIALAIALIAGLGFMRQEKAGLI